MTEKIKPFFRESNIFRLIGVIGIGTGWKIPALILFTMRNGETGKTEWEISTALFVYLISGILTLRPEWITQMTGKLRGTNG